MTIRDKLGRLVRRLNGSTTDYTLTPYYPILNEINALDLKLKKCSDAQLQALSKALQHKVSDGIPVDALLIDVFALVRQVAQRRLNMRPFDVQLLGALALQDDKLTEMQTGEGKTLTAVLPACLNALSGQGVHILTFNDYLAKRDSTWMGPIYDFLGLSVGYVQEGMSIKDRQKAYNSHVTYLTAKEAGFDFLRDSLCYEPGNIVQRPFHMAIIDEADSILIDEARIPLVIAGSRQDYLADASVMADIARRMQPDIDFLFDEYARNIHLTDRGQNRVEKWLPCDNLYAPQNIDVITRLHCALHAQHLLQRDIDYIVRNDAIELVDEFTGRTADRRRWPDGLQAALEAKENIHIQSRGHILNQITLQHFVQHYPKLCGMTATAQDSEGEFKTFYNLEIAVIPPNKSCIRQDQPDIIFRTKHEKYDALVREIVRAAKTGRPILVGTSSVSESEVLAQKLSAARVDCSVLNAKNDALEADIIAQAGQPGAVTISTNMAGRGTDIRLGQSETERKKIIDLGGLYVLGTTRHESKRIDLQLRGRAGRQGDPGESRYFISLEDDLLKKYRLSDLLPSIIFQADASGQINNDTVRKEVARLQRICEGQNLEIKKTLCRYSDLLEKQRVILFDRRQDSLFERASITFFQQRSPRQFHRLGEMIGQEKLEKICRMIMLFQLDEMWANYLAEVADVREGIHLNRLGGRDPYIEFQKIAVNMFDDMLVQLDRQLAELFDEIAARDEPVDLTSMGIKAPSATWTYLINDNPFENQLGLQLIGNTGMQVAAGVFGPLLALQSLFRKYRKKQSFKFKTKKSS